MAYRIQSGTTSVLNPFGPEWPTAKRAEESRPVGEQVQDALFGKRKPDQLDLDEHPEVKELLAMLDRYRKKFAVMAGDGESDYRLQLAKGTIAMVDEKGTIFVGLPFLLQFETHPEVLIGAIAHEIGHRPQRWAEYKSQAMLTKEELDSLCRYEETRADLFAGQALAEMNISPEPMIQFLENIEEGPHPDYFPATMRADVIREGYNSQKSLVSVRKKLWPELDKLRSPKNHIGDF